MSDRRNVEPVEDYTDAFLVSFGVLIFIALVAICTFWGMLASLLGSWLINKGIGFRTKPRNADCH